MATMITDDCIGCGACVDECPNEAISVGPDGFLHRIDPHKCTECVGFNGREACAQACPADCCLPDPARVETEDVLLVRAQALHPGRLDSVVLSAKTSRFRR